MTEIRAERARGKKIEIWFQDEARIGQKNKITRRWARRGSRPRAPHDQRTKWVSLLFNRSKMIPVSAVPLWRIQF